MRAIYLAIVALMLHGCLLLGCGQQQLNTTSGSIQADADKDQIESSMPETPQPEPDQLSVEAQPRTIKIVGPTPPLLQQALTGPDEITLYWDSDNPGDYNRDGIASGLDIFPLALHFGEGVGDNPGNECIDGNGDTTLNGLDVFPIAVNFLKRIDGVYVYLDSEQTGEFSDPPLNEPAMPYLGCNAQQEFPWTIPDNAPTYFALRSYDDDADEYSVLSMVVYPSDPPENPQNVVGSPGVGQALIEWEDAQEIDFQSYEVGRSPDSGGPYTVINPGQVLVSEYIDTEPEPGETWFYVVRALDVYGAASGWSAEVEITVIDTPVVEGLTWRGGTGDDDFDLGWLPDTTGYCKGWIVEKRSPPADWQQWYTNVQNDAGDPEFGLIISKIWGSTGALSDYRVCGRALDDTLGDWVEVLAIGPSDRPEPPAAVESINQDGLVQIRLNASPSADRIGYNIYYSTESGGPYIRWPTPLPFEQVPPSHAWIGEGWRTVNVGGLTNETDYYFVVTTVDDMRTESEYSEEVLAHPSATPATPTGFTLTRWYGQANLAWDANTEPDIDHYVVLRGNSEGGPYGIASNPGHTDTFFIDTEFTADQSSWWTVRAVDSWGVASDLSPEQTAYYGSWQVEIVDNGGYVDSTTSIAVDPNGDPGIAYADAESEVVMYAHYNGTSWDIEPVIEPDTAEIMSSLAFDAVGYPAIAFHDLSAGYPELFLARFDGDSWTMDWVYEETHSSQPPSLAFDSAGRPAIAFQTEFVANTRDLLFAHHNGIEWTYDLVDDSGLQQGDYPSLVFDSTDHPYIAYQDVSLRDAMLAVYSGGTWNVTTVADEGPIGFWTSLALDSNENPRIGHSQPWDSVHFAGYDGVDWNLETVTSTSAEYISLCVSAADQPMISFKQAGGHYLYFAWWDGVNWNLFRPDPVLQHGNWASMTIDEDDNPIISYVRQDSGNLKVAWYR